MRFRLKICIYMIWLLSLAFAVGGSLLISESFDNTMRLEREAAEASFRNMLSTLRIVEEADGGENDVLNILSSMRNAENTEFESVKLYAGGKLIYSDGSEPERDPDGAKQGISVLKTDDGKRYYRLCGNMETEWDSLRVVAYRDVSGAYELRNAQYASYAEVFAAALLVGGVLSYLLAYMLTRPLKTLTAATKKISEGDLKCRSGIKSRDEFGQLSESFDAMAQRLEESMNEMQDSVRRREEFMGSFAHEMKTPMTSIIGYADFIRSGSLDEEEQMNAANYIFSEGKRLESLSAKLLDIIVMNNRKIELRSVSPAQLISHLVEYLKPIYSQEGIVLQYKCEEGECLLEPDLVKSLVSNLIDNSRKSFTDGGNIYLRSRMLPDGCEIRVLDNGPGIPPEAIDHLTEAFYRVDKSRSRMQGGAGLGLALCSDIAKLHNGSLRIESRVGNGTEVTAELHGGRI